MVAQVVEQWTENPCVGSSTLLRTTKKCPLAQLDSASEFGSEGSWFEPKRDSEFFKNILRDGAVGQRAGVMILRSLVRTQFPLLESSQILVCWGGLLNHSV